MDSDSSLEEERNRNRFPIRPNMNDNNSDVSDEENISRAARSIESPPESPQGNFESPPASPDPENNPGTPSPIQSPEDSASYESPNKSPESQNDSRNLKDSPPRSPDSFFPRSPSPVQFLNRTPPSEPRSQSPRSPSPIRSPSSNHSFRNKSPSSPVHPRSPRSPSSNHSFRNKSPSSPAHPRSPRSPSSNHSFRNKSPSSPVHPRSPRSPNSIQSPTPRSPSQRSQSPNSIRSPSPYRRGELSQSPQPSSSPRRRSPQRDRRNSDDGRSNISSASSFSTPRHSPVRRPQSPPQTAAQLKSHVEDLSDVSDLESLNSMSGDESEMPKEKTTAEVSKPLPDVKKDAPCARNTSSGGLDADDTEQLDFEAEEKEEGECEMSMTTTTTVTSSAKESKEGKKADKDTDDEGELKGDELEEGEISDEGENRPEETEPRPVCRFYNRGQCTWGSSCRFVHPGVTDKGNYTMFEMVRPLVPVNGPLMYGVGPPPPMDPYRPPMVPMERPMMGPPPVHYPQGPPPIRKEEAAAASVTESAWERGLRQAKEMLRKSSKRKETEVDFEEKKMNLSIGQDDLDKENDYYSRTASPVAADEPGWGSKPEGESKRYRTMSERFDDYGGGPEGYYYQQNRNTEQVWHQRPHYDESMRSIYSSSRSSSKYYDSHAPHSRTSREKEYYSSSRESNSKRAKYNQREVIVQRAEKPASWKEDSPVTKPSRYAESRSGGRGDEWADPWMRAKTSPLSRKQRSRKASYSSGSSYSSSSSSRSSRSSSSSYSRSRSSRSRSRSKKPSKLSPPRRLQRPSPPLRGPKVAMVGLPVEKKPPPSMMMNPPPPSPKGKGKIVATNPSPPIERMRPGVPARISKAASAVAAAMRSTRSRSKSSRSSGSSDSSGSSSDSSESSLSSSSSSRPASPPVHQKRIVIDERLALAQAMNMKVKAMDALKLSGQKQQIKLTLKGSGDRTVSASQISGKKRPAESPPLEFSPPKNTPKKTAPSRREELLKQLKAVEDAIARKRSKIS